MSLQSNLVNSFDYSCYTQIKRSGFMAKLIDLLGKRFGKWINHIKKVLKCHKA
jgi:hypothetical protein